MTTKVYGASDDLVEFDGDVSGEVGHYGSGDDEGILCVFSDGTLIVARFGDGWELRLRHAGPLFECIDQQPKSDVDGSDVAHFKDGLAWAYAAKGGWEKVQ